MISLSICNPSYNNSKTIPLLISSIEKNIETIKQKTKGFELLVFDNCSTDDTKKIITNLNKSWVRYVESKNHLNGRDSAVEAASLCQYEYVWFIGDDSFVDFGIPTVINHLIQFKYDIFIVNSLLCDQHNCIRERHFINRLDCFPSTESLLQSLKHSVSHFFIGNFIIHKNFIFLLNKSSKTFWPHIEAMISYFELGLHNIGVLQSTPIVIERESSWYACPQYDVSQRSLMFLDLLNIAKINTTTKYAYSIKEHALNLFINILKYHKSDKKSFILFINLWKFSKKHAIDALKFKIRNLFL